MRVGPDKYQRVVCNVFGANSAKSGWVSRLKSAAPINARLFIKDGPREAPTKALSFRYTRAVRPVLTLRTTQSGCPSPLKSAITASAGAVGVGVGVGVGVDVDVGLGLGVAVGVPPGTRKA